MRSLAQTAARIAAAGRAGRGRDAESTESPRARHDRLTRALERGLALLLASRGVRERWFDTDVARHHIYLADGRGRLPPVVILHGLSDSATSSAVVMLHLRRRARRVIAVEAAGHGRSGQPRVEYTARRHRESMTQVIDSLVDEPAILVGNSLGGATAIHYALERPEKVRALLLTSPAGGAVDLDAMDDLRRAFSPRDLVEARALLGRLLHRPGPLAALASRVVLSRTQSRAVTDLLRTLGPHDIFTPDELARVTAPLHIVWGKSDRLLPASMLAYFRAHLPAGAVFREPEKLGHCPHLEDPLGFARLVAEFAARHA